MRSLDMEIAVDVSLRNMSWHQNRGGVMTLGGAWREPVYWPGGVRHEGDVSLICCFHTERGKACPDTAVVWR